VLEQKEYEPLGSTLTERADVRIVAATHQDLASLVEKGNFREDLFYRLNVMKLEIPPLHRACLYSLQGDRDQGHPFAPVPPILSWKGLEQGISRDPEIGGSRKGGDS